MIIWKGMGLAIPIIAILFHWLTSIFFDDLLKGSTLHIGVGLLCSGTFWLLTMKRREAGIAKVKASNNPELIQKMEAHSANPTFDPSIASLFFIPLIWWHYILWAAGLAFLIVWAVKS